MMRQFVALLIFGGTFAISASAAEPTTELKTVMTERGKLLISDAFGKPLSPDWKTGKGKWEIVDGALSGAELKEDMHGAVTRHNVAFTNGVIQISFKLDGAKTISLSLNGAKGHVGRLAIRPNGFTVQKDDQDGKDGPDKTEALNTSATPISTGEWHTIVFEIQGKEMLATLDGKFTAYGQHNALDKAKSNLGLTVAGASASFKNLSVWEATPHADWEKVREKYKK